MVRSGGTDCEYKLLFQESCLGKRSLSIELRGSKTIFFFKWKEHEYMQEELEVRGQEDINKYR